MDLSSFTNPTLLPGQRLLFVNGYEAAEKYPLPRDCQAALFDENDNYLYIKSTDTNGGIKTTRYRLEEEPIPKFEPNNYVTIDDFSKFKEEILNGINSIQQSINGEPANNSNGYNSKSNNAGNGKQSNKSGSQQFQSAGNV